MRMVAIVLLGVASACGSCKHGATTDAGASPGASQGAAAPAVPAPLSLPIAADADPSGHVYVAGFVAARGAVSLSRFDDTGRLVWAVDALDGLSFSSDAQIDVVSTPRGATVAWRGLRHGKRTRSARWVGDDGKVAEDTFDLGSTACSVGDSVYWIGGKSGTTTVMMRTVPAGADETVYHLADGIDPTLVCGASKRAWVVEEGEDSVRARPMEGGKALTRATLIGPDELGDDDVRDHDESTTGDGLDTVILTEKNQLIVRSVGEPGGPKRVLDHQLGADEGLMAFDGNPSRTVVLLARDANARCDGDTASDVVGIDIPRAADQKERMLDLAHGECGKDLGPYWVAPTDDTIYVAWSVRGPRTGIRAPVEALVWTKLDEAPHSVPLSGENVVFAGCHAKHCAFAALVRPDGTDGMTPGEARVLLIP